MAADPVREKALSDYRKKLMEHKEVFQLDYDFLMQFKLNFPKVDARLKDLRNQLKDLTTAYAKSEDDLKVMFEKKNLMEKSEIQGFVNCGSV